MAVAKSIPDSKEEFNRKADRIRLYLARKLTGGDHAMLLIYRLGLDHLENLKRLHTLTRRITSALLDITDELEPQSSADMRTEALPKVTE